MRQTRGIFSGLFDEMDDIRAHGKDERVGVSVFYEGQEFFYRSLAIIKDGKIIKAKGYGLTNLEVSARATPNTVHELASMTKQFTATAIMMLLKDGKLSLEDKITRFVPDLPAAWRDVTIRHLLNHTSGIPSHTELPVILNDESREYTRAEMLAIFSTPPVKFQPGEYWAYNDSGYFLLGMVVERASGKSYEEYLSERIFRPLGMTATRENVLDDVIPHRAAGYVWRGERLQKARAVNPTQSFGGGHLISTVLDLAKWDAALYGEGLLPRSLLEQMWTPTRLGNGQVALSPFEGMKDCSYGYGWFIGSLGGHRFVEHGGSISSGFSSEILRLLDDRLTVIVLTNRSADDNPFAPQAPRPWDIARGVANLYIPGLRKL